MDAPVHEDLRKELLAMVREDFQVRETLVREGTLFEGYQPRMREVHERNADRLAAMLDRLGAWPDQKLVGDDGAESAWIIAQHAISRPSLMRRSLELVLDAVARGTAPMRHAAHLDDRIRVFEGRPQRYGTQFDWNEQGEMVPKPIEDPAAIEDLREEAGLMPFFEAVRRQREAAMHGPEMPPDDWRERERVYELWLREVGWRDPS